MSNDSKKIDPIGTYEYSLQLEEHYLQTPSVDPDEAEHKAIQNANKLDALDGKQDGIIDFAEIRSRKDFETQMKLGGILANVPRVRFNLFSKFQDLKEKLDNSQLEAIAVHDSPVEKHSEEARQSDLSHEVPSANPASLLQPKPVPTSFLGFIFRYLGSE